MPLLSVMFCVFNPYHLQSWDRTRRKEGRKDGRMEGRKEGRTDGRTDGRKDGRTDGSAVSECCADTRKMAVLWRAGNGFIEGKELENFFQELEAARRGAGMEGSSINIGEKLKEFMQKYDKNADGRIEMAELAQILPTEENFLLCFRQHAGSSTEFMEAWRKYDTDRSGYIEANELKGFLSDLLKKANRPFDDKKLQEYTQTILRMFDLNGDGKLCLSEMSRLLPVQENFLLKFQGMKLSCDEFNAIFNFYDKDRNGYIDENELDALLKDFFDKSKKNVDIQSLTGYRQSIMSLCDGGRLYRKELEIVLCNDSSPFK